MKIMSQFDIAWMAGIIEGEGCIAIPKRGDYPVISVSMADKDIIERLQTISGIGSICSITRRDSKHKMLWKWTVCGKANVARLLLAIYPIMGERRKSKILKATESLSRPYKIKRVAECGTISGRNRHVRLKEPVCDPCRLVANEHNKNFKRAKRNK